MAIAYDQFSDEKGQQRPALALGGSLCSLNSGVTVCRYTCDSDAKAITGRQQVYHHRGRPIFVAACSLLIRMSRHGQATGILTAGHAYEAGCLND
jgi:hypothetical protein